MTLQRAKKDGSKYLNPVPTQVGSPSMMFKVLPLYFSNKEEAEPKVQLGPFVTDAHVYRTPPESGLRVTWMGHSTMLLEIDGFRLLLDPVWEKRASPAQWFGPKRFFAPPLELEKLPGIDVVLLSHDHYDHMGKHTIKRLARLNATSGARWVTSAGVGKLLRKFGVAKERIAELDWTQSVETGGAELGRSLKITALPARHFSGRGLHDRFTTLWSSFVIEGPRHRVYFGADSGYWDGFEAIGAEYGPFDLTMLEIGAFHPLWSAIHMGPDGAVRAYEAMGGFERAGLLMPIHWGLFNLALHAWDQPIKRFLEIAERDGLKLWSPEPGKPTEVRDVLVSRWWKR